jgi:DNA-binding transcriptional LysR family regulator
MFSINHYRYFVYVADTGSFRLAAERACRSQPAVSLAIREMEERLGQPLFIRANPVRLSSFGQSCIALARQLVAHADLVAGTMGRMARSDTGYLSIASVMSVATHWMPGLLQAYRQLYPNVMLNVHDDNSEGVEQMLINGQVELGLCSVVSQDSALAFQPLYEDEFGLVCHRSHPVAHSVSLTWRDLASLPLIGTVAHKQLRARPEAAILHDRPLFIANMLTLLAMLRRNLGVTVLARLGVPPEQDDLVFVPLVEPVIRRTLGLRTMAGAVLSPSGARMTQLLEQALRTAGPAGPFSV